MTLNTHKEKAIAIYQKIYLARQCEETVRREYAKDQMKTPVHLSNGAEAIPASVLACLPKETKTFGTYRNHSLYLTVTEDTDRFFGELYGRVSGCDFGKAGSMHLTSPEHGLFLTSAVVGTTIPPAVGTAFANWYKGNKHYVAVFFGDGAMEEGAFWESLNFACLRKLKILFVCENNELAIHTHIRNRQGFRSALEAIGGFDCYSAASEGYIPQKILDCTQPMIEKMEQDQKPGFLYFDYFRFLEHVGVNEDFQAGYREKPDEKTLQEKDPVLNAEKWVRSLGTSEEEISSMQKNIDGKIKASLEKAKSAPFPAAGMLYDHVVC